MDIAFYIIAILFMGVFMIVSIWGFILFYKLSESIRKQNMMLFSILDKLTNDINKQ